MMDWDKAYDNRAHIEDADVHLARWQNAAQKHRNIQSRRRGQKLSLPYGPGERNVYDLFLPESELAGVAIFIHGGYWRALDKDWFSHLAAGPLAHGYAVAIPSYTLAPQARIREISREIANAITVIANDNKGPIRLIGHSAGGHLVARMLCDDNLLGQETFDRIKNTVAVSGLFDLHPLTKTRMNDDLRLDSEEVQTESPVHLGPRSGARVTCFVGGGELPEFLRQNELLTSWKSNGAEVKIITDQGKHHFSVIDALAQPSSLMTMALLA